MNVLYIDCQMGAAGDMLMGALMDMIDDHAGFLNEMNQLGISGAHVWNEQVEKCGYTGNQVHVDVCVHHHHRTLHDIRGIIDGLPVSNQVKSDAKAVYDIIAKAEAHVHGEHMESVHFHEVGALDAVTDVVGTCMLMDMLDVDQVIVSPIHVGSGTVNCAHGTLPVPAPATAKILEGMPTYGGEVRGELCTPTGAALLKHFGQAFGPIPEMKIKKSGRGMGTKEFPGFPNGLGVLLGEIE